MFSALVEHDPSFLLISDSRGAFPLDSIVSNSHVFWVECLERTTVFDKVWPVRSDVPESAPIFQEPHSKMIVCPDHAMLIEVTHLVAYGRMTLDEVLLLI